MANWITKPQGFKQMGLSTKPQCSLCVCTKQRYGPKSRIPFRKRILFDAEGRQKICSKSGAIGSAGTAPMNWKPPKGPDSKTAKKAAWIRNKGLIKCRGCRKLVMRSQSYGIVSKKTGAALGRVCEECKGKVKRKDEDVFERR